MRIDKHVSLFESNPLDKSSDYNWRFFRWKQRNSDDTKRGDSLSSFPRRDPPTDRVNLYIYSAETGANSTHESSKLIIGNSWLEWTEIRGGVVCLPSTPREGVRIFEARSQKGWNLESVINRAVEVRFINAKCFYECIRVD